MNSNRSTFLAASLGSLLLTCFVSQSNVVCASPPAQHAMPPRAAHQVPARSPQTRVVHALPARKISVHRQIEIVRPKPAVRQEEKVHREVAIERHEVPARRVEIVSASTPGSVQNPNFNDAYAERHPHFSAALKSLIAAHQILQQPAVAGDLTALGALKTAKEELTAASASARYHAHRSNAMELTGHAIHELEGAPSGNPDILAQMAIQDVQYCIYMADHPGAN